jgi:type II secretory pathway component PulM
MGTDKGSFMNTLRTLFPWVLFLLMSLLTAFFWHQSDQRGRHIKELSQEMEGIEMQLQRLGNDMLDLKALAEEHSAAPETAEQ